MCTYVVGRERKMMSFLLCELLSHLTTNDKTSCFFLYIVPPESKSIHHIRYIVYGSSVVFRLLLIIWGVLQDRGYFIRDVPYTDIDYVVFSDAAREISHGGSPYDRTTYRYTPFLAWLLLPNGMCWLLRPFPFDDTSMDTTTTTRI